MLERRFIDMGRMKPGSEKDVSVGLRNEGGEMLTIRKVETGCKCVVAAVDRRDIGPGQGAKLNLKVRTLKHRGPYTAKIAIASSDPADNKVLTLYFEVPHRLAAEPAEVCFGVVRPGQQLRRKVRVTANGKVTSKVLYAIGDTESLIGLITRPGVNRDAAAELDAVMTAPTKPGTYRHSLNIATALKERPTLRVPVLLSVSNSATVEPPMIDFGRFVRGSNAERTIDVALRPGTHLVSATAKRAVLDVRPSQPSGDGRVPITLKPNDSVPFGPVRGEVRLRLAGDETSVLSVRFRAYVTEAAEAGARLSSI